MVFIMNNLMKLLKNFVFGLFGVILCFLFLLSIFQTSKVNSDEQISFHWDVPFLHIIFLILICSISSIVI